MSDRREKEDTRERDPLTCIREKNHQQCNNLTVRSQSFHDHRGFSRDYGEGTNTSESEKDTTLFRQTLQRVLGVRFIFAAANKDRNLRPLINFV